MPPDSAGPTRPASVTRTVDEGLLFPLYQRTLFTWAVRRLPARVSPNTITIVGQVSAVLATVAAAMAAAGHRWLYAASAALFMGYMLADNLDGMHARRTGQTSQSGELLDHGLDAISCLTPLLAIGIILRVEGGILFGLACLGMAAFIAAYWEQYRTGLLHCPAMGQCEGFTGLAVIELALLFLDEPPWLLASTDRLTLGTLLVLATLVGSVAAIAGTVRRVAGAGVALGELLILAAATLAPLGYLAAGAAPWMASVVVALFAGDVVVRTVRFRRRGTAGRLVTWSHAAAMAPLAGAALPGLPAEPTMLAGLGAAVMGVIYAHNLWGGLRESRIPT